MTIKMANLINVDESLQTCNEKKWLIILTSTN